MDLAEILELEGDTSAAEEAIGDAIRLYELKGNELGADRARKMLAVLAG